MASATGSGGCYRAGGRTRTDDLAITNRLRYQLRHTGKDSELFTDDERRRHEQLTDIFDADARPFTANAQLSHPRFQGRLD
jgi:hypothetical protein